MQEYSIKIGKKQHKANKQTNKLVRKVSDEDFK